MHFHRSSLSFMLPCAAISTHLGPKWRSKWAKGRHNASEMVKIGLLFRIRRATWPQKPPGRLGRSRIHFHQLFMHFKILQTYFIYICIFFHVGPTGQPSVAWVPSRGRRQCSLRTSINICIICISMYYMHLYVLCDFMWFHLECNARRHVQYVWCMYVCMFVCICMYVCM